MNSFIKLNCELLLLKKILCWLHTCVTQTEYFFNNIFLNLCIIPITKSQKLDKRKIS